MITFENITYKNFLASGNTPIKINLKTHDTTLIVGQNGAGKSTMIEAIVFALFNKSFRKVNKQQLINSINEKDCLVEVRFCIGNKKYKVIRGMKPNKFEIWVDGKMLDQVSSVHDQQKYLEQNILKLNYKSFTQIVILGSASFVPFMQLPAASRREIIEDLLDIRIFSTMNVILKDRVKVTSEEIKENDRSIKFLKEKAEMQQSHLHRLEKSARKTLDQKEHKIVEIEIKNNKLEKLIDEIQKDMEKFTSELLDSSEIQAGIKKLEKQITTNTNLITRLEKEKTFFDSNDKCPKCTQPLPEHLKEHHINESDKIIKQSSDSLIQFRNQITDLTKNLEIIADNNQCVSTYNWEVKSNLSEIKKNNLVIREIRGEIEDIKNNTNDIDCERKKLTEIATEGMTIHKRTKSLKSNKYNYDIVTSFLKDTGIKSHIIKKYLPVMNQMINKYLKELDFYVNFTLDEEFNESIKSRHRDDFSYSSFSEGEKMRIDLALMFTWRSIAKLKNSANTNLLILDEVFDSSLDVGGTDEFMRIIRGGQPDTNIFVISHKSEVMHDKFDRVLKFEKKKNFSKVEVT
jgi:DNA repair exonuclease SbcCD ATPase subunit